MHVGFDVNRALSTSKHRERSVFDRDEFGRFFRRDRHVELPFDGHQDVEHVERIPVLDRFVRGGQRYLFERQAKNLGHDSDTFFVRRGSATRRSPAFLAETRPITSGQANACIAEFGLSSVALQRRRGQFGKAVIGIKIRARAYSWRSAERRPAGAVAPPARANSARYDRNASSTWRPITRQLISNVSMAQLSSSRRSR